jgi:hypothetical protein
MPTFRAFRGTGTTAIGIRFTLIDVPIRARGQTRKCHRITQSTSAIGIHETRIRRGAFVQTRSTTIVIRFVPIPNAIKTRRFTTYGISVRPFAFLARAIFGDHTRRSRRTTRDTNRSAIRRDFAAILNTIVARGWCAKTLDARKARTIPAFGALASVITRPAIRPAAIHIGFHSIVDHIRTRGNGDAQVGGT